MYSQYQCDEIMERLRAALSQYRKTVNVKKLLKYVNPLTSPTWTGIVSISFEEIKNSIEANELIHPLQTKRKAVLPHENHVKRIAYLVVNKDIKPISLLINMDGTIRCSDGNHRLAAAIYRGDETIEASIRNLSNNEDFDIF